MISKEQLKQIEDDNEFIRQFIPWRELKKVGFFGTLKRNEHAAIVKRFLEFLGTTKREYVLNSAIFDLHMHPDFITGKFPDSVDENGELKKGDAFKLSL